MAEVINESSSILVENKNNKRVVAIVGRPNVGKSSLFNCLAGRRIAIVHEEAGVTRDRVTCEVDWKGSFFELIDTGGLSHFGRQAAKYQITADAENQTKIAITDASSIILVTDIIAGLTPLDQEVARLLHECGRTVMLAANKADHPKHELGICEFDLLGFPTFPVSALQNRGIEALVDSLLPLLPPHKENSSEKTPLRVAVVGRPNTGKSSYINRLLHEERVIVSDIPGTTRDSIGIPFTIGSGGTVRHYELIDTAGIRKKSRTQGAVDWFSNLRTSRSIEHSDITVMMLDAEKGPSRLDKKAAAAIVDARKGCILMINKWDMATKADPGITQTRYLPALRVVLPFMDFVPVVFVSAKTGYNIRRSVEIIDYVAAQTRTEITTGVLNRVIRQAFEKYPPPAAGGKRLKVFYATQSGTSPLYFKIFVNNPSYVRSNWLAYLRNRLRSAFGLEGAPLFIKLVARS